MAGSEKSIALELKAQAPMPAPTPTDDAVDVPPLEENGAWAASHCASRSPRWVRSLFCWSAGAAPLPAKSAATRFWLEKST